MTYPASIPGKGGAPGPHAVIIGGGASGVLMAAQLLALRDSGYRVTIIEGRNMLGCGVAYSTTDPDHILNTRVHNMSAFASDPDHFQRWLGDQPEIGDASATSFVSRATYGTYMAGLLAPWATGPEKWRMKCLRSDCIKIEEHATGVVTHLGDGRSLVADVAILATGHVLPEPDATGTISSAWDPVGQLDPDARVVIIGTGLSMVDQVLSLLKSGHRGEILSVSRRGQLPRSHAATKPLQVARKDVPLGASMSVLFGWARDLARQAEALGGTWRDAVDGIRPHVRLIWRNLPKPERARFLRHAAVWWDVHRHRIPPASDARISAAIADGRLKLIRASFRGAERQGAQDITATIQRRRASAPETITAGRIIDCRGIRRDPAENASPLMADLLARGAARVDALRIGLDVAEDCRIIDTQGVPSRRILAIGPASRSAFWEITAIPDIREQAAEVAQDLTQSHQPAMA